MPAPKTILILEDDPVGLETMTGYFKVEGYNVLQSENVDEFEAHLKRQEVSLVILDMRLPGKDGLTVLKDLRSRTDIPVIVVSARTDKVDHIVALEIGADDYLDKPVEMRELLVRTKNLLRRMERSASRPNSDALPERVTFDGWALDDSKRQLIAPDGATIRITRAEFDLLSILVKNVNRVFTREQLHAHVSKRSWRPMDRSVDVLIGRLRSKIELDTRDPKLIVTVHGVGYAFLGDTRNTQPV